MTTDPQIRTHTFHAIGCDHAVLVTDPAALAPAARLAEALVAELDCAASRFRPDSEVSRIAELRGGAGDTEGDADVMVVVSPLLGGCIEAALHAADITDGLVDPTVGRAVAASGYDADLDTVRRRAGDDPDDSEPSPAPSEPVPGPGWRRVAYDPRTRLLTVPQGTLLDLGATAKAYAADLVAERLAAQLLGGFLVNLGGDIAVSGTIPADGWEIGVEDHRGVVSQVVVSTGQAIATSSTQVRTWTQAGEHRHHVVDPRTGHTAASVWALVSCAGVTAVEANAASTAAIVLGAEAPAWLEGHGIPARLDYAAPPIGAATVVRFASVVTTPGWPAPERRAA
ncbi:MAG: FAD:protein FMN transferase [Lapillicoccus sp.]